MLHIDAQKDKKVPQKLWWVFLFLVFRKMPRLLACAIICGGIDVYFKLEGIGFHSVGFAGHKSPCASLQNPPPSAMCLLVIQ